MQEDAIVDKVKNYWERHARAIELFARDDCFICNRPVVWGAVESDEANGRMFNFTGSDLLIKEHWCTICRGCLKRKILKEILEEGLGGL